MADLGFHPDGKKVFFDISSILDYVERLDHYSGIQRVVAELIAEFANIMDNENIYLSWCTPRNPELVCVPIEVVGGQTFLDPADVLQRFFPNVSGNFRPRPLRRYKRRSARYYFHRTRLDLASLLGRDRSFRRYDMTAKSWAEAKRAAKPRGTALPAPEGVPLASVASEGDHLVLLDSSWQQHHRQAFAHAKKSGVVVHSLVYDLIPILLPETTASGAPTVFYDWLLKSADYTDRYLAISDATKRDLEQFLEYHDIERTVHAVPLTQHGLGRGDPKSPAADMTGPVSSSMALDKYTHIPDTMRTFPETGLSLRDDYALCVGTLEPRKNVLRLVLAWKYLLDQGHVDIPKLVFAGRRGWSVDEFDRLLQATGNLYSYVKIVNSPSDEVLDVLYRNSQFTLMPSIYEGWGLPVGEALAYGKTAVVGDNSSLVEVGQDLVEYCDAKSVKSIAEAVLRVTDADHRQQLEQRIQNTKLRDWTDVARDLGRALYD